jgi:hypothetical protein
MRPEAENLFLRHQLNIALRRAPPRLRLRGSDRALMVWLVRLWPSLLGAAQAVKPETILRWHRVGFRAFPNICRIASIVLNDATILPYGANPFRMEFSDMTGNSPAHWP